MVLYFLQIGISQEMAFPEQYWKQYQSPEEAGYASEKLKLLEAKFAESGGDVLFVVHNGKVLLEKGPTTRRFRQASVRKSYLSALFGPFIDKGKIRLDQTLEDLKIDDLHPLSTEEKKATTLDLLAARSGIYLPAAYTTRSNKENMPARGSHTPGTFWYYNNWDFNTLVTIFNQQTSQDFFETFQKDIASPLQLEDFRLFDTYYRYEDSLSQHPAYLFKMSARDMARFGLLYLHEGRWKDQQLIPQDWVKKSTAVYTEDLGPAFNNKGSYGLLWWISDGIEGEPMYYASGAGGQRICILPKSQLVFVHLTNTYQQKNVGQSQIQEMITLLLQAKSGKPIVKPKLSNYQPKVESIKKGIPDQELLEKIPGIYRHRFLGEFNIQVQKKRVFMTTGIGKFNLIPTGPNTFFIEDMEIPCEAKSGNEAQQFTIETIFDKNRMVERVIFYY